MKKLFFLFLLYFFLFHISIIAQDLVGPLEIKNLYMPSLFLIDPNPVHPALLNKGDFTVKTDFSLSNTIVDTNVQGDLNGYLRLKDFYAYRLSRLGIDPFLMKAFLDYYYYNKLENYSRVRVDGEIYRSFANLRYGWNDRLELGLDIGILSYNTGVLDKSIDSYHHLLKIRYAERDIYKEDQFSFIMSDDRAILHKGAPSTGLGDTIFSSKYRILPNNRSLSFVSMVKIPTNTTGNGSGRMDVGSGIAYMEKYNRFHIYYNAYILFPSNPFHSTRIRLKPFVSITYSLEYFITHKFRLLGQVDFKSSPYNTPIELLNMSAVLLSFGINYKLSEDSIFQASFTEDPVTATVPDISANISLTKRMR